MRFVAQHHAASIKQLRDTPAEALLRSPSVGTEQALQFGPVVDGWVLPDTPNALNANGKDNDVPVITGSTAGDSAMFTSPVRSLDEYHQMNRLLYGEMAAEFEKLYPVTKPDDIQRGLIATGEKQNNCNGTRFTEQTATARQGQQREAYSRNSQSSAASPGEPGVSRLN